MAIYTGPVPPNCEECNGNLIARDDTTQPPQYFLWKEGVGWWGFYLKDIEAARLACMAVGNKKEEPRP